MPSVYILCQGHSSLQSAAARIKVRICDRLNIFFFSADTRINFVCIQHHHIKLSAIEKRALPAFDIWYNLQVFLSLTYHSIAKWYCNRWLFVVLDRAMVLAFFVLGTLLLWPPYMLIIPNVRYLANSKNEKGGKSPFLRLIISEWNFVCRKKNFFRIKMNSSFVWESLTEVCKVLDSFKLNLCLRVEKENYYAKLETKHKLINFDLRSHMRVGWEFLEWNREILDNGKINIKFLSGECTFGASKFGSCWRRNTKLCIFSTSISYCGWGSQIFDDLLR